MDVALEVFDTFIGDKLFAAILPLHAAAYNFTDHTANATILSLSPWKYKPSTRRLLNYLVFATLSYIFIFDKEIFKHPKFLKRQIRLEIKQANKAMPVMAICTTFTFLSEVRGFCKLYDATEDGPGRRYGWAQFPFFILFTDIFIYWLRLWLHLPLVYRHPHKPHHKWIMPSPYANRAFYPLDGFAKSLPYHVYPIFTPLNKLAYAVLFVFINFWTILIHDGEYITDNPIINGSGHTAHHLHFNCNYGQFTTLWDRLGGSYREPDLAWFNKENKMSRKTWESNMKETEEIQREVEGADGRQYVVAETKKKNRSRSRLLPPLVVLSGSIWLTTFFNDNGD
ncbi:fatty acid hydroxylase superfamily protein [Colletotrichum zoysiae]|uniref:Fatty acid hydroxylase superfamily protein n=1 Tax=Colletotrichum zoysiae TaxID=1216348 RepID=A0AAD9HAF9_9PEZI|nr:fatty acid hydroxylase superfamily protein [Colletotrichum zoysiae]